jgi:hypothetical protein
MPCVNCAPPSISSSKGLGLSFSRQILLGIEDVVDFILLWPIFRFVPVAVLFSQRTISPGMRGAIDAYVVHFVIAKSCVILHCRRGTKNGDNYVQHMMVTVIRRVWRYWRVFPHERVVYEPHPKGVVEIYRHGEVEPMSMEIRFPQGVDTLYLPLTGEKKGGEKDIDCDGLSKSAPTKLHDYYRFERLVQSIQSLVHVFFRPADQTEEIKPHCLSVSLEDVWLKMLGHNQRQSC